MIYNNFDIIHKDITKLILGNKPINKSNLVKCIFINHKIIINLPNYLNDKYLVSVIGILDYKDNGFISKYYLIYDNESNRDKHINSIACQLNDYLNKLNFINNNSSIILNNIKIGTIVKNKEQYYNNISNNINIKDNNNQNCVINNNENNNSRNININNINDENQYNQYSQNPYIYYYFSSCPKIGLENIGATCYMNATLQCFCHIEKLINFFKYKYNQHMKNMPKKNGDNLSSSFKLLVDNLWPNNYDPLSPNNKKFYAPHEFKNKISKMNPFFKGNNSNNINFFLKFIIIRLHKELNIKNQMNNRNEQIKIDKRNLLLTYQKFMQEIIAYNNSIISDLFYGINCNMLRCCNCNSQVFDFHSYFLITFPLEEVYDYKNKIIKMQTQVNNSNYIQNNFNRSNINQPNASNNNYTIYQQNQFNNNQINYNNFEINIYDCFDFNRRIDFNDGDNLMYCEYCKNNSNFYLCKNLITCPKILIISLNNVKAKSNIKFNFPDRLNLYNYIQDKNSGIMYKLIGVITHIDIGNNFVAFCTDPITNKWCKYNDITVSEVKDFQSEIINSIIPSVLFYQKINS